MVDLTREEAPVHADRKPFTAVRDGVSTEKAFRPPALQSMVVRIVVVLPIPPNVPFSYGSGHLPWENRIVNIKDQIVDGSQIFGPRRLQRYGLFDCHSA